MIAQGETGDIAMPDILIRGLSQRLVQRLKARAKRNGRSLQGEAKRLLESASGAETEETAKILERWKVRFAGRKFSSSADMIRQDRNR
jgi:plasmid stability protein